MWVRVLEDDPCVADACYTCFGSGGYVAALPIFADLFEICDGIIEVARSDPVGLATGQRGRFTCVLDILACFQRSS